MKLFSSFLFLTLFSSLSIASYDGYDESPYVMEVSNLDCTSTSGDSMKYRHNHTEVWEYDWEDYNSNSEIEFSGKLEYGALSISTSNREEVEQSFELVPFTHPLTGQNANSLNFNTSIKNDNLLIEIDLFNDSVDKSFPNAKRFLSSISNEGDITMYGEVVIMSGSTLIRKESLTCKFSYTNEDYR